MCPLSNCAIYRLGPVGIISICLALVAILISASAYASLWDRETCSKYIFLKAACRDTLLASGDFKASGPAVHQPTGFRKLAPFIDGRKWELCCQSNHQSALAVKIWVSVKPFRSGASQ